MFLHYLDNVRIMYTNWIASSDEERDHSFSGLSTYLSADWQTRLNTEREKNTVSYNILQIMYLYTCRMGGWHVRHSANIRIIIHGTINKMISQANVMPGPADASIWNDLSFWQTRLRCRTRIPTSIYLSIPQVILVCVRFIPSSTTQSLLMTVLLHYRCAWAS